MIWPSYILFSLDLRLHLTSFYKYIYLQVYLPKEAQSCGIFRNAPKLRAFAHRHESVFGCAMCSRVPWGKRKETPRFHDSYKYVYQGVYFSWRVSCKIRLNCHFERPLVLRIWIYTLRLENSWLGLKSSNTKELTWVESMQRLGRVIPIRKY